MLLDSATNRCYLSKLILKYNDGPTIHDTLRNNGIHVEFLENTLDIWCRDYMPIQISDHKFIGYEYTPDYLVGAESIQTNPARICRRLGVDSIPSGIILDGGNVIKTSRGVIMIDKIFKENSHIAPSALTERLEKFFESNIIFLPWDKAEKFGHADGVVRDMGEGKVIMTNYHQFDSVFAEKYMNILSKHYEVQALDYNVKSPSECSWCYINFLRIGNKIFLPQTGKREDDLALEQFIRYFPECNIIPTPCLSIVNDGGALNCVSWNIKR